MFKPLESFKQEHEYKLSDEWRELHAEGRRRIAAHEQIETETLTLPSGKVITRRVGRHTLPPAPEVDHLWAEGKPDDFALYQPNQKERDGLAQELVDLNRDAGLMRKHETVKYE